ncbi:hypothetical protein RvY_06228 [Ramazzottius varieornatus]|uniref:Uncharacterized protein n=1 Tax=Ramazzottius varieornatus TaxID=947166 RepID=A0A1D1V480_RAMVA|nr:hypothetical protein RvY_06228 [Ramazzottius varieornatus]
MKIHFHFKLQLTVTGQWLSKLSEILSVLIKFRRGQQIFFRPCSRLVQNFHKYRS